MNKNYVGEYFKAVYALVNGKDTWSIYQIDPTIFIAHVYRYDNAVDVVNRLDVTGDNPIGSED